MAPETAEKKQRTQTYMINTVQFQLLNIKIKYIAARFTAGSKECPHSTIHTQLSLPTLPQHTELTRHAVAHQTLEPVTHLLPGSSSRIQRRVFGSQKSVYRPAPNPSMSSSLPSTAKSPTTPSLGSTRPESFVKVSRTSSTL